jgi:hypothetical protein
VPQDLVSTSGNQAFNDSWVEFSSTNRFFHHFEVVRAYSWPQELVKLIRVNPGSIFGWGLLFILEAL